MSEGYKTPLGRARGLGPSHHGVGHFINERVTGLALVPLALWAAFAGLKLAGAPSFEAAKLWLQSPINATLLAVFLVIGFLHLKLTIQVVIEDYVYGFVSKSALLIGNVCVCVLGAATAVISILMVALGGGAG